MEGQETRQTDFTHFDARGNVVMVDVGPKPETERMALARGSIFMSRECIQKVADGSMKKGDVLAVARVAGIMGAKKTSELIPLCHQIPLTRLEIDFDIRLEQGEIAARCVAESRGRTGVEMEALTGVTTALLTIYDMCKAVDKTMQIGSVWLEHKTGGKSGEYRRRRTE